MAKKRDRLRAEGPTWCTPSWNGDPVSRFLAEELRADGYDQVRKRTIREANRAWEFVHRPWETTRDLRQNNNLLAPYWLPYIYCEELHGATLRELTVLVEFLKPQRVLDIGCGVGIDACFLATQFPKITLCGTDVSPEMIKFAKSRADRRNLQNASFIVSEHRHLPSHFQTERVDLVYAHGSILYIDRDDLETHIAGIAAVLKPGGIFFCEMPMQVSPHHFIADILEMNLGLSHWTQRGEIQTLSLSGREICWSCAFRLEPTL